MISRYFLLALALTGCDAVTAPENPDITLSVALQPAEPTTADVMTAVATITIIGRQEISSTPAWNATPTTPKPCLVLP